MGQPKISVVIPVYGVEKYIEQCARSLFEQTMQEGIEYVFVDDCSPDRSIEILEEVFKEYPHRDPQVKIIRHPKNPGPDGEKSIWIDPLVSTKMYKYKLIHKINEHNFVL